MIKVQKLELTWIGKEERPRLEPRILLEDQGLSYHAGTGDGNRLLLTKVKCVSSTNIVKV